MLSRTDDIRDRANQACGIVALVLQFHIYAAAVVVSFVSCLHLRGDWIGEAGTDVVMTTGPSTMPEAAPAVNNGGALPATAKLDSAK